ncbi:MAG: stage II sporulation protein R [Bacillaceae bacterium]|nr:stage II sporulation protein R [Bacillaceae bacterium]
MKRLFYILFALIVLWLRWEHQESEAALAQGPIPEESIRLRIIANSDSLQDQWLKRKVRDAVVDEINGWVGELEDAKMARDVIRSHLPEIKDLVKQTMKQYGFDYGSAVKLGMVPFPTKMYGSYVYPAGEYEALRITLGKGLGQNWWCVLFPPLCFVDMSNGDAVEAQGDNDESKKEMADNQGAGTASPEPEVRFFLLDLFKKILSLFT